MKVQRKLRKDSDSREHFSRIFNRAITEATEEAALAIRSAQGGHRPASGEVTIIVTDSEFGFWLMEEVGWKKTVAGVQAEVYLCNSSALSGYEEDLYVKKAFARGFRQAIFKSSAGTIPVKSSVKTTNPY